MGPLDVSRPWDDPAGRRLVPVPAAGLWRNVVDEETGALRT